MTNYATVALPDPNNQNTLQTAVIPGRENDMTMNNAGGAVFKVDMWTQLDRFLILGTEQGTYYVNEFKLTLENAKNVQKAIKNDGLRAVARTVEISDSGRARKNDAALFVLAMAASSEDLAVRRAALDALPKVARIGTHLFHFAEYVKNFRGYGRGLRTAISKWYLNMPIDKLALQAIKYQQRDGWSHRDLLRLSHPQTSDEIRNSIFKFLAAKEDKLIISTSSPLISAYQEIQKLDKTQVSKAVKLIRQVNLPREAIPTEFLNSPDVWSALLEDMPLTAMIRNLGKMSSVGILDSMSIGSTKVVDTLSNSEILQKARIHPMAILDALKVYSTGCGVKGSLTWKVNQQIVDALDNAFYGSFKFITPTGKNVLISVDCSGSMDVNVSGSLVLSCRDAAAALALVTANVESNYEIVGFSSGEGRVLPHTKSRRWGGMGSGIKELKISPNMRLDQVATVMSQLNWGATDCSLPAQYATSTRKEVDAFITITDSETYAGSIHPSEALVKYRQSSGRNAKQIVVGMTASNFSIADPSDAGQLDVVGFDSSCPSIIADFLA